MLANNKSIIHSMKKLIQAVVFVSMTSFMVGYHVHEKAIIVPTICQALLLVHNSDDTDELTKNKNIYDHINENSSSVLLFLLLSMVGTFSLFPLFTDLQELVTKGNIISKILFTVWL